MAEEQKRLTFTKTKEMEDELKIIKKEFFYNHTRSYMFRELITLGLHAAREEFTKPF